MAIDPETLRKIRKRQESERLIERNLYFLEQKKLNPNEILDLLRALTKKIDRLAEDVDFLLAILLVIIERE
jgi:hypothetical protein